MRGKKHSPEVRAAVMAALLAGQGVSEVAKQYKLDTGLVSRWRAGIETAKLQQVAARQQDEFSELLANYLREALETLSVQVRFFRDTTWLSKQDAAEIATLHERVASQTIRLLEAAERASGADTGSAAPDNR